MASKIEKLQEASFRGISFLVPIDSTVRGQKIAIHEYPNSDTRFAEPLGKIPRTMSLTCIIHGEDFIQNRLNFEQALEEPGIGTLIHPVYGIVDVQVGEFTVDSNQKRIGESVFKVAFYSSVAEILPFELPATEQTVTNQANSAWTNTFDALEEAYEAPTDGLDLQSAVDSMLDGLTAINSAIDSVVNPIESAIATVNSNINDFTNGIFKIMQTASGFKDSLENLYNNMLQLTLAPDTLSGMWSDLMGFESGEETDDSTVRRTRNNNNTSNIGESTRLLSQLRYFESIAFTDFNTTDDLNDALKFSDDNFNQNFENNVIDSLANDPDLRSSALQLQIDAKLTLNAQLANIWRVVDINPGKSSMSLTAYRYYGSHDNLDQVIDLNPLISVANFKPAQIIKAVTK